jgi:SPP1 family predicted phage head-tail adaptor
MRAGMLRHRVTVQERTATRDALGGASLDWTDRATVWADVSPLSGRERLAADAGRAQIDHIVTIRYQVQFADPVAMARRRLLYNGRILTITASRDVDERHFDIELSCTEGMNEG